VQNKNGNRDEMHQHIMGDSPPSMVDHSDQDRLDSKRCNLRSVINKQNTWNGKRRKDNSIDGKGISTFQSEWVTDIVPERFAHLLPKNLSITKTC
jgi:hypothetical protein